jgi:DNA-directed RNA polymerase subunit RPC12/RpoP
MQITCSKCKKVYNVDPNRIPSGATGTKCKACGNPISLRPAAPQKPAPPQAAVMQITCQYCSKKYNINAKSIPAGVTSMKCKACSHAISLKPKSAVPGPKPVPDKTAGQDTGTRQITCLYCGKKYSIKASRIPPGVTTTRCTACGRSLSLIPAAGLTSAFKDEISKKVTPLKSPAAPKDQQVLQVPIIQNIEPSTSPVWRKPWALAAAAAVVVLCIGVYYTGSKLTQLAKVKLGAENVIKKEQQSPVQRRQSGAPAGPEPVMAARFNVPLLLEAIDQNMPEDKKNLKYKMAAGIFKSFALSKVQLYLYPHPEHTFLPVILAESDNGQNLEKQLKSHGNYVQFLERLSDGSYAIKKEAIPENKQNNFPIDLYRLQFIDNTVVFAPQHLSQTFKEGEDPVRQSQVAQMMASIAGPRDLALLSLRIPEDYNQDWQKKIQSNPALQQNPQAAMIAAMGSGVLAQLSEPLKGVESLAIGFRLDDTNGRQLSYAQQFRKGVNGQKVYQQLKSGNRDDFNASGIVLKLIELLNDPRYHHNILYKNNRLTLELSWEKQHDKTFLTALSEATLGQIFAQSMDLTPSEGPITVQYEESPRLSANVDVNSLKQTIPGTVQQSLFPGNYWSFGDQPRMTLELDKIDLPNASLAQLTYEVLEVLTTDGTNVMRAEENQFQHEINPGSASPGTVDLNVKKGTAAETLGTAKIRFLIRLPVSFKKVEFASGNSAGTLRESEGVQVKLGRLEKDVAKITYRGGASAQLFAFDRTGRSLAARESMNSSSSVATRFQGEISTLMVVVVQEMLDYPFEVNVDLNGGKELSLSHQPQNPKRQRYDNQPGLLGARHNR